MRIKIEKREREIEIIRERKCMYIFKMKNYAI